jgi:hypothetical protein
VSLNGYYTELYNRQQQQDSQARWTIVLVPNGKQNPHKFGCIKNIIIFVTS